MSDRHIPSVWAALRQDRPSLVVRIGVSGVTAAFLAGLALWFAWGIGLWHWRQGRDFDPTPAACVSLLFATIVWLAAQAWIWGPLRRRASVARPIVMTLAIWLMCLMLLIVSPQRYVGYRWAGYDEYFFWAFAFLALAATLGVWTSALHRWSCGRPLRDAEGRALVHCPNCRYRLTGLTECRCPECGSSWTIDELILAQGYATEPVTPATPAATVGGHVAI